MYIYAISKHDLYESMHIYEYLLFEKLQSRVSNNN